MRLLPMLSQTGLSQQSVPRSHSCTTDCMLALGTGRRTLGRSKQLGDAEVTLFYYFHKPALEMVALDQLCHSSNSCCPCPKLVFSG